MARIGLVAATVVAITLPVGCSAQHKAAERALYDDYRLGYAAVHTLHGDRRPSRPCELAVLDAYPKSGGAGQHFRGQKAPGAFFVGCMTRLFGGHSDPAAGAHEVLYGDD